jgi:hypothetical protein
MMDHQPRQAQSHANEVSPSTVGSPPSRRAGSEASPLRRCTLSAHNSSSEPELLLLQHNGIE